MNGIDEVISKVKKLYALAEANTSEHEAAVAIAAAEKLLQLYRLSRAEVEIHTDAGSDHPTEDPEPVEIFGSRVPVWQSVLISALSSHYGCVTYQFRTPQQAEIRVVGRPSDVQLFRLQYDRIRLQIERLTASNGIGKGRSYCDSYRKGLVVVIDERLLEMRDEVRGQASSTALVKLDEREVFAWRKLNELHQNLRSSRSTPLRAYDHGYEAGRRDGHLIGLGEELEAPTRGLPSHTG